MARPRCVTYNVVSMDSRLTLAPGVMLMAGDPRWEAATAHLEDPYAWVRDAHDPQAIIEGSGSLVSDETDDPVPHPTEPPDPGEVVAFLPPGVVEVPGRKWFVVVDGRGRVRLQFTEWPGDGWRGWHALVLTSHAASSSHLAWLRRRGIPYVVVGRERVDLVAAMELIGERLGVRTAVCTGGGRLGGAMLRAGLVDEIDIEILPVAIGGRGTPALFDAPPLSPGAWPTPLELLEARTLPHGHVRLRYRVCAAPGARSGG